MMNDNIIEIINIFENYNIIKYLSSNYNYF